MNQVSEFSMARPLTLLVLALAAVPAAAQLPSRPAPVREEEQPLPPPQLPVSAAGRPAASAVGVTGQRQTREAVRGIEPMARINSRIPNRVRSRLRTRIDRDYDPQASAAAFAEAEDQTRTAGRRNR